MKSLQIINEQHLIMQMRLSETRSLRLSPVNVREHRNHINVYKIRQEQYFNALRASYSKNMIENIFARRAYFYDMRDTCAAENEIFVSPHGAVSVKGWRLRVISNRKPTKICKLLKTSSFQNHAELEIRVIRIYFPCRLITFVSKLNNLSFTAFIHVVFLVI